MQEKVTLGNEERTVDFSVVPGGAIKYRFTAMSKAKKPVPYVFEGTFETYQFNREPYVSDYVNFHYWKADGAESRRWSTWSARDRWAHVCRFINQAVLPAAVAWSKTDDYRREHVVALRHRLERELVQAEQNVERRRRDLDYAEGELAGARAKLATFDERHGTVQ